MIAGYSDFPGYGNTPLGGIQGFTTLFAQGKRLNDEKSLGKIDALILWGGSDIGTSLYNEKPQYHYGVQEEASARDVFEWELIKKAVKAKIPIIGVCRGAQILCAFAGGKLVQHTGGHLYPHSVKTYDGKVFEQVSSSHHQMMFPFHLNDDEYEVLATTNNLLGHFGNYNSYQGITLDEVKTLKEEMEPEVVFYKKLNAMAIQSHPEWQVNHPFTNWCLTEILCHLFGESKE